MLREWPPIVVPALAGLALPVVGGLALLLAVRRGPRIAADALAADRRASAGPGPV